MHLKSLVLKGFKSFADRSVLGFEPGITAIVGPNGSGKSNVSDSVLWVLGERNAKNLRGQAMEDVIFAGSSARKPVGIAEVDLVLDNTDGTLPIDFSEVAITRRMYRSGESEYLINGTVARRMDVLDILHDTGLGTGTHSIISQGSLDSILQSKPEDRRAIIEEAAGVLKHKQRKQKSERKLEQMDVHLTRVKDVAAEVERQLKPLERKAKRAQAYQGLADELAELNLALAVDDLRVLQKKWDESSTCEKDLEEKIVQAREQIEKADAHMQNLQEQVQQRSVNAGDVARQHRRATAVLGQIDSAAMLFREKRRSALEYEEELQLESDARKLKRTQALADRDHAQEQLAQAKRQRAEAEEVVERYQREQQEVSSERSGLEKAITALEEKMRGLTRDIESTRSRQAENNEALSSGRAHEKLITGHAKELEIQIGRITADLDRVGKEAADGEEKLALLKKRESEAREKVASVFAEREQRHELFGTLRDSAMMIASEIRGCEERERASAAAGPALAWLMENKDAFEADIAPLAHVVKAPKELESLVERLLGGDLLALFVNDAASANLIAERLCSAGESGEVVLLPKADMNGATARSESVSGAFALIDRLEYPREYADALSAMLGDVYVCDTLAQAFAARAAGATGLRFATQDGCVVWESGKVSIGNNLADEEGALALHRHLEELRESHVEALRASEEAERNKNRADEDLRAAQSESLKLSQELAQAQGSSESARQECARIEEKAAALRREYEDLERQRVEAKAILEQAQPTAVELDKLLADLISQSDGAKTEHLEKQNAAIPLRGKTKRLAEALAEARLKAATSAERETYAQRMFDSAEAEIAALDRQEKSSYETLICKRVAKKRIEPVLDLLEVLAEGARAWSSKLEEATVSAEQSSAGLHSAITEAREQARKAHDGFDAVNEQLSQARVDKGRLEIQVEAAVSTIVEDCKVPLERALSAPELENRAETEDKAFKLRRRIANMGTINPDAAEEFDALKKRYDYMESQLDDLLTARRALSKIVRVIDARMKDDFIRTFEEVNTNFKEIFAILFPGGSAELSLVDPEDPDTSGVEVTAQPQGKRITKMMLMSGGEKSLTALALLFAVYRIRATPFYILDEVEAALDDSNLRRLCAFLDSLRETTQLIMITHQRRTMEMADVLYGISMQADGVTKVVSQKLDRALQHAEG